MDAQTALLAGLHRDSREDILAAVDAGADPGAIYPGQTRTPLHWATQLKKATAVAALLEAGAVPQALVAPPDSDGGVDEEAMLLPQLIAFDSTNTDPAVVAAWWEGDPRLTAIYPLETKSPEGMRPWVATPLSLLLLGVSEYEGYVAPGAPGREEEEKRNPALAAHRKTVRECLARFQTRPAEWTPEAAQAVACAAVGTCSPAIWDEEGPLKRMGLELSMAPFPAEVLAAAQTVLFAYPQQVDRATAWMRVLAPLGADWNEALQLRNGSSSPELEKMKNLYRQWALEARLPSPEPPRTPKPRF